MDITDLVQNIVDKAINQFMNFVEEVNNSHSGKIHICVTNESKPLTVLFSSNSGETSKTFTIDSNVNMFQVRCDKQRQSYTEYFLKFDSMQIYPERLQRKGIRTLFFTKVIDLFNTSSLFQNYGSIQLGTSVTNKSSEWNAKWGKQLGFVKKISDFMETMMYEKHNSPLDTNVPLPVLQMKQSVVETPSMATMDKMPPPPPPPPSMATMDKMPPPPPPPTMDKMPPPPPPPSKKRKRQGGGNKSKRTKKRHKQTQKTQKLFSFRKRSQFLEFQ